ncbi:MAG: PAS domain S-box protein [Smithella sp.]
MEQFRILILEDNPSDADLVQFELEEARIFFTARVVMTEDDFICQLQEFSPDLILSDYDFPKYNGALALAEAKRRRPDTPFILVTGAVTEDRAIEILTQGAKDYVLKNRLQHRLVPAVRRAIAEAKEHRLRKQAETELREAYRTMEERIKIRTAESEVEITARKKLEEALRESETSYRELVENANCIIIKMDQNGILTFVNDFAQKFFGYSREEYIGMNMMTLIPSSETTGRNLQAMADALRKNPDDYIENINENIRKNGERAWISWRNKGIRDSHGNIIGNLGIGQDITELKRAEELLRESEKRLALAASSTQIGMFDWDIIKGRVLWTQTHDAIFGYAPTTTTTPTTTTAATAEYDMHRWADRVHPDDLPFVEKESRRCMLKRKPLKVQYRIIWPDGSLHWVETRGVFQQDGENKVNRMLGVVMDITDRKQAEIALKEQAAQLEDANKELESFSYSVSHDLKAPLRAIDGYSRMLVKKYGNSLDEDAARLVNVIRENTECMSILIDDLLSFSRVLKSSIAISELNMDKLVKEVWAEIKKVNAERELELKVTNILPGKGDPALIKQVLVNLISNAVKFTKTRIKGIIEVGSYNENGDVAYCIKDNGVGFDMAYYDKLFGVFQRLHSHEEYEGTGVGLAIVQRIINRHGGHVWAKGKVDRGATFCFTLPHGAQSL